MKVSLDSTWFSVLHEQDEYSPNTGDEVTVNLSINSSGEDFTTDVNSHVSDALEFEPKLRYAEFIIIRKQTCDVSRSATEYDGRSPWGHELCFREEEVSYQNDC